MKFDNAPEIKSKEKAILPDDVYNFAENFDINPDLIINQSLDENGNIINAYPNFFEKELVKKFGEKVLEEVDSIEWSWKIYEYQEKLIELLKNNKKEEDIKKIIAIQSLLDLAFTETEANQETFGPGNELKVAQELIEIFKDKKTTILEKIFLKEVIYGLYELDDVINGRINEGNLEKKIGENIGQKKEMFSFSNPKFNRYKFEFNENQRNIIINDIDPLVGIIGLLEGAPEYWAGGEDIYPTYIKRVLTEDHSGFKEVFVGDYINSQISPEEVGIYTIRGRLVGWKKIDELNEKSQNKLDDTFKLKKEGLINSPENLALFKISSSLEFREYIKEMLDIDLSKMSLENQLHFLGFIQNKTEKKLQVLNEFINRSTRQTETEKYNKMKTFLSLEQGGQEMGDKILKIGQKLPEEPAKKLFEKYGEIIDNVNKITEFTKNNFSHEIETNPELIGKIEETLYLKGKQLLSQTYENINNKNKINYEDISKQLDRINADTITTFAIFKQAIKNGEKLPIESIEGSVFSKKDAFEISTEQQKEMLELYGENWKNYPDQNFVESLKEYFKTSFNPEINKSKNYFYTFEKDDKTRAFVRFEKQNDQSLYASALNVDEASKNFGLGEAMMDEALIREAQNNVLHASCRKDNPSNMRYFEKGFISKGFKKTNNTEEFNLIWDEVKNKNILAKQKTQEEIMSMQENTDTEKFEIRKSKNLESLHTNIPEGKSLVRCFVNNGEWYAVYENIQADYGVNPGETK